MTMNTNIELITKQEARTRGLVNFFTGKPCKRGHVSERRVLDGACVLCRKEDANNCYHRNKDKNKEVGAIRKTEYRLKNKEKINERRKVLRSLNPERHKIHSKNTRIKTRKEKPWVPMIQSVRSRAKKNKIVFDLDYAWAESVWTGRCAITGLEFDLSGGKKGPKSRSPSVDRIIPELGYVKSNCRIILQCVNVMKGTSLDNDMKEVVRELYKFYQQSDCAVGCV